MTGADEPIHQRVHTERLYGSSWVGRRSRMRTRYGSSALLASLFREFRRADELNSIPWAFRLRRYHLTLHTLRDL